MNALRRKLATALAAALLSTAVVAAPAHAAPVFGSLEFVGTSADGNIDVIGWAINPSNPYQPVNMALYLMQNQYGGWFFGMLDAAIYRAEVGAAYPQYGTNHGFHLSTRMDETIEIQPSIDPENPGQFIFPGTYDLCVYAAWTLLGCRPVTVTAQILALYWP
jgi:hypothetical protein